MKPIISAKKLQKKYGKNTVLNNINLQVNQGEIIGVVGINGAGKTTLLKSLLGLTRCQGELEVCQLNPYKQQAQLMKKVSFIADTAILPKWITTQQLLSYMEKMHPSFSLAKAQAFLSTTDIKPHTKVSKLSKGMVTQLHLALVVAIQSELLVLDEPTLGLDIIRRKQFYGHLLDDYFDENNTIIIPTHQIEDIEHILTRVVFIDQGTISADFSLEEIENRFTQITVNKENSQALLALQPIYSTSTIDGECFIFDGIEKASLRVYGQIKSPSLSDLFVALSSPIQQEAAYA